MVWIVGGFLLCPCHLPLTLSLLAVLLAGTAAGALRAEHLVAAGLVIAAAWLVATRRGVRLLQCARAGTCRVHTDRKLRE